MINGAVSGQDCAVRTVPLRATRRILDAASLEIAEHGFDGARVDEIARRAGVTKQLIYYYYGTKSQLCEAVLDAASEESLTPLLRTGYDDLDPTAAVRALFSAIFDQYRDRPALAALTLDQNIHHCAHITGRSQLRRLTPAIVKTFAGILERGVASGAFRAGIDPQRCFAIAFVLLTGCFFSGRTLSVFTDVDLTSAIGVERWREDALDLIIAQISAPRPKAHIGSH